MFVITAIMQFIIPDIPVELKTQIQREQLLAKEAKYQHGLNKSKENEYQDLLQIIRDQNNNSRAGLGLTFQITKLSWYPQFSIILESRGGWARRFSRLSRVSNVGHPPSDSIGNKCNISLFMYLTYTFYQ